jgi:hypothetical protein
VATINTKKSEPEILRTNNEFPLKSRAYLQNCHRDKIPSAGRVLPCLRRRRRAARAKHLDERRHDARVWPHGAHCSHLAGVERRKGVPIAGESGGAPTAGESGRAGGGGSRGATAAGTTGAFRRRGNQGRVGGGGEQGRASGVDIRGAPAAWTAGARRRRGQQGRIVGGGSRGTPVPSTRSHAGSRPGDLLASWRWRLERDLAGEDLVGMRRRSAGAEEDGRDLGDFFPFIYFSYKRSFMWY